MQRPSHKELYNKIREARKAVASGSVLLLEQDAIAPKTPWQTDLEKYDIGYELSDLLSSRNCSIETSPRLLCRLQAASAILIERKIEGLLNCFAFAVNEEQQIQLPSLDYKFALAECIFLLLSLQQQDRPLFKEEK